ncbi:hypothetical protein M9H77_21265 [Catharanthus roseus]|uniref:Uncharacterized protein n=1 Tax=Catharanthus roseus TaxID=4058 RepID=A0ACC0ANB6_CATRO|nr:hypothetical protein M9H77_21265 [Catharanthus roseus]
MKIFIFHRKLVGKTSVSSAIGFGFVQLPNCEISCSLSLLFFYLLIFFCSPVKYPESWKGEILAEKIGDAYSCLTLHLNDDVLREIDEKDNAFEIWTKLEKLYLGKSLVNKIYFEGTTFWF